MAIRQIAFQPHTLPAVAVEQEQSRCPDRIKAVEPCRMFLNVGFYWKEILADEFGSLLIFIRLGIQPSTGSSPALKSSKMGRNYSFAAARV